MHVRAETYSAASHVSIQTAVIVLLQNLGIAYTESSNTEPYSWAMLKEGSALSKTIPV